MPAGRIPHRPNILSPEDAGWLIEDVWPSLFFGRERVAEMRRKVGALSWARATFDAMRREADLALAHPPQLPTERCGWRHDFYSRRTAAHLLYEPDRGDSFLDPTTGRRERDEAQRRAWALLTHERTFRLLRSVGFLYRLTGEERYATWVAAGLRAAAEYFTHGEFHHAAHAGRALYFQPLYDAAALLMLADAYDLTRDSAAYGAADHARIRHDIFEERMPDQIAFVGRNRAHNMDCFVSATLATVGRLLDRPEWLSLGLGAETGLRAQLLRGIPTDADGAFDGFWHENSLFYHYYTICPLIALHEREREARGEVEPAIRERLVAMLATPPALVAPGGLLPPLGDLGAPRTTALAAWGHLYEYAAGQLDRDRFAPILAATYATSGARRGDLTALAFGPDDLPPPGGLPARSTVLPVARIGVFRGGEPAPFWALFRAGEYRRGHDHPDRLSLFLHAHGEPISPDLGEPGYSLRERHGNYYRTTLAHNTLFVDEADQAGEATLDWLPDATPPCARGGIKSDGAAFRRTVFFDPPYVVLLDECEADRERRFGWVYHANGAVRLGPVANSPTAPPLPPLPTDSAWALLTDRATTVVAGRAEATWSVTDALRLRAITLADAPFEVTTADAPGQPYADRQGVLLFRQPGRRCRFLTVLEVTTGEPSVAKIAALADGGLRVALADGREREYRWPAGN